MINNIQPDDLAAMVRGMKTKTSPFRAFLNKLHQTYRPLDDGKLADAVPELSKADPQWFGICAVDKNGQMYEVGDSQHMFKLQAIARPFVYGLARADQGRDTVMERVGVEPADDSFKPSDNSARTCRTRW